MGRSMVKDEDLITRREAADLAGVHVNTVRLWESTGRVESVKREDGVVMVPRAAIEAISEARRAPRSDAERVLEQAIEIRELRTQLSELQERYDKLLSTIISIAQGKEEM